MAAWRRPPCPPPLAPGRHPRPLATPSDRVCWHAATATCHSGVRTTGGAALQANGAAFVYSRRGCDQVAAAPSSTTSWPLQFDEAGDATAAPNATGGCSRDEPSPGATACAEALVAELAASRRGCRLIRSSATWRLLERHCAALLAQGRAAACVDVLVTLAGARVPIRALVPPERVLEVCLQEGGAALALRYASLQRRLKTSLYTRMITELGRMGDLAGVRLVLDHMLRCRLKPDSHNFRAAIDACARNGNPAEALAIFKLMKTTGVLPNVFTYNSLLIALAAADPWPTFSAMAADGVEPDGATWAALLKSCTVTGRADVAISLWRRMEAWATHKEGRLLDIMAYTTLIQVLAKAKMWQEALSVRRAMEDNGVQPNVVTWTALIGACAQAGLVEQAFSTFHDMVDSGVAPTTRTYNMLINACIEAGQVERAFLLLEEMKGGGRSRDETPAVRDYHNATLPSEGPVDLMSAGWRGSPPRGSACSADVVTPYSCTLPTQAQPNRCSEKAAPQARRSDGSGWIDGKARRRDNGRAGGKQGCAPDEVTYSTLMKACGAAPLKVRKLMVEMEVLGMQLTQQIWNILLDSHGSTGDLPGALQVFKEAREAGVIADVVAYTALIKACVRAGDEDHAFAIYNAMKERGVKANMVTFNTLLRLHRRCNLHEVQRALALYEEMRDAGYAPNDHLLRSLLKEWAEGALEGKACGQSRAQSGSASAKAAPHWPLAQQDDGTPKFTGLLLQRVACHARDGSPGVIDLHGLSKTEARTAVLSVLRLIKERHGKSKPVLDDLVIITGVGKHSEVPGVSVVREAVLHVLQVELGLPVLASNPHAAQERLEVPKRPLQGAASLLEHDVLSEQATRGGRSNIEALLGEPSVLHSERSLRLAKSSVRGTEQMVPLTAAAASTNLYDKDEEDEAADKKAGATVGSLEQGKLHGLPTSTREPADSFELIATTPFHSPASKTSFLDGAVRRPSLNPGRLKVPKDALNAWLAKRKELAAVQRLHGAP
eukprot:SM000388S14666  [mRNA]  locus=s388:48646:53735:+ [translate_table: standard]